MHFLWCNTLLLQLDASSDRMDLRVYHSAGENVDQSIMDVSMLILGDSVDRAMTWDVNDTAQSGGSKGLQSLLNEHWRVALSLPHLEIVRSHLKYQTERLVQVGITKSKFAGVSICTWQPHCRPVP